MLLLAITIALGFGALAVAASYRRRGMILAPNPLIPSPALTSVLLVDIASALLLALVVLDNSQGLLLLLPLLILVGYIAVVVLLLCIRPKWRASPLFLLGVGAPLLGCILAFLILFAERRNAR